MKDMIHIRQVTTETEKENSEKSEFQYKNL